VLPVRSFSSIAGTSTLYRSGPSTNRTNGSGIPGLAPGRTGIPDADLHSGHRGTDSSLPLGEFIKRVERKKSLEVPRYSSNLLTG
jgi:hypothetical protein